MLLLIRKSMNENGIDCSFISGAYSIVTPFIKKASLCREASYLAFMIVYGFSTYAINASFLITSTIAMMRLATKADAMNIKYIIFSNFINISINNYWFDSSISLYSTRKYISLQYCLVIFNYVNWMR